MAALRTFLAQLGARRTTSAAMLVAWFALIITGAGPAADTQSWIGIPSFDWLSYVLLGLMALGAVVLIATILTTSSDRDGLPPKRKPLWPLFLVAIVFLLLMRRDPEPNPNQPDIVPPVDPPEPSPPDVVNPGGGLGGQEAMVLLVMLAVAVAVLLASRRRVAATADHREDQSLIQAVGPAVAKATEQLLTGTDPRSAVLLAYRTLESALERNGVTRDPAETPSEYLQRALSDLSLDTVPLLTLSELYQEARYSTHEITVDDQRAAQAALEQVGRQLQRPVEQQ